MGRPKRVAQLLCVLILIAASTSCSVYMAAKQPEKKNLSVLTEGTPQSMVRAELGTPVWVGQEQGYDVEVYTFTQGYSKGSRATRTILHGVADVLTLGLWEVVGTPTEMIASGTKLKATVTYDQQQRVKAVRLHDEKGNDIPVDALKAVPPPGSTVADR